MSKSPSRKLLFSLINELPTVFEVITERKMVCYFINTIEVMQVSKDIDAEGDSVLTRMLQAVAVLVIGNVCHVFMHGLNHVQVYGAEKLHKALHHRPKNKSLITICQEDYKFGQICRSFMLVIAGSLWDCHCNICLFNSRLVVKLDIQHFAANSSKKCVAATEAV